MNRLLSEDENLEKPEHAELNRKLQAYLSESYEKVNL